MSLDERIDKWARRGVIGGATLALAGAALLSEPHPDLISYNPFAAPHERMQTKPPKPTPSTFLQGTTGLMVKLQYFAEGKECEDHIVVADKEGRGYAVPVKKDNPYLKEDFLSIKGELTGETVNCRNPYTGKYHKVKLIEPRELKLQESTLERRRLYGKPGNHRRT